MPTETGQNVTVRFSTPETPICDTIVIWKFKESDVRLSSGDDNVVKGAIATIPINGWLETATITAVCRKGLNTTDRNSAIVPPWRVASSCLYSEYLRVYDNDDQKTLLELTKLRCMPCPRGADCSPSNALGVEGSLRPLKDHWQIPWRDFGQRRLEDTWAQPCVRKEACNVKGCIPPYTGKLCAMCEAGSTRQAGRLCLPCPETGITVVITLAIFYSTFLTQH
eukprot:g1387.t1